MDRTEKQKIVEQLREKMSRATAGVLTQLNGMDVATMTDLRRQLRAAKIEYRVVKNTLARLAAEGTNLAPMTDDFTGPVALALSYGDPVAPAKVLADFLKSLPPEKAAWLKIRAGILQGQRLDPKAVAALASLPSLPELRSKMLGLLSAPASALARLIQTPGQQLARVLDARKGTQEQSAA
jgi:large subunit ribosomal protein L10